MALKLSLSCHGCERSEEASIVRRTWLQPIFIRLAPRSYQQTQLCPPCAKWHPLYWLKVRWRLRIGRLSSLLAPGYSACGRCHTNWHFADEHSTSVTESSGCFPLCEQCWAELSPPDRLPFYRALYDRWEADPVRVGPPPYSWEAMRDAVLAEGARP